MKQEPSILEAMTDDRLFGPFFKRRLLGGDSWKAWRAFLATLFGLPLDAGALEIYRKHTQRCVAPDKPFREAYVIAGRRSGKSVIAALVATFLAVFKSYEEVLAPGEVGTLMVIAADRRQARVIFNYVCAFFEAPLLRRLVASQLKESLTLTNRVVIEIHTCSFRATRGYTLIGVIADELAFWNVEGSANPDSEVLNALRPGLATTGGLLLGVSSPYAKRGALWGVFREHFGKNESDLLVWRGASGEMNPTLSRAVITAAYVKDAASARAEWGGEFRDDVEDFLPIELLESLAISGQRELPPLSNLSYVAFCDPSGGRSDSMTLAIAHSEKEKAILDVLLEVEPPFSPEQAVADFATVLKRYRISEVEGDRYAGEWPREQFAKRGIAYRVSERTRSEIYLELLPLLTSGRVELLENRRMISQAGSLERRTGHGRDVIDHAPGSHDDCINSAAGALVRALQSVGSYGVLEYFKQLTRGEVTLPQRAPEPKRSPQELLRSIQHKAFDLVRPRPAPRAKQMSQERPACPVCKAACVSMCSGQWHCNSCSHQWPAGQRFAAQRVTRSDLLSRRFGGQKFR